MSHFIGFDPSPQKNDAGLIHQDFKLGLRFSNLLKSYLQHLYMSLEVAEYRFDRSPLNLSVNHDFNHHFTIIFPAGGRLRGQGSINVSRQGFLQQFLSKGVVSFRNNPPLRSNNRPQKNGSNKKCSNSSRVKAISIWQFQISMFQLEYQNIIHGSMVLVYIIANIKGVYWYILMGSMAHHI